VDRLSLLRCAGVLAGAGLTAVFAVGSAFLGADLGETALADLLVIVAFLAVFLRLAALVMGAFFRFRLALPLAFLLVAITASWTLLVRSLPNKKVSQRGSGISLVPASANSLSVLASSNSLFSRTNSLFLRKNSLLC
jgi:hypothetical protein